MLIIAAATVAIAGGARISRRVETNPIIDHSSSSYANFSQNLKKG